MNSQYSNKRQSPRIPVQTKASIIVGPLSDEVECVDLSQEGCRIRWDHWMSPNTLVVLRFYNHIQEKRSPYEDVTATVRWTEQVDASSPSQDYGVQFYTKTSTKHGIPQLLGKAS